MRGLGNRLKCKCIFNYLRDKELDVIFLQETHTDNKNIRLYENEWGSKWNVSSGTSNSRGVAILFSSKMYKKCEVIKFKGDHLG